MSPESNLPIEANTNPNTVSNIVADDTTPWTSNPEDEVVPTITVTVSNEDAVVEDVSLIRAENVASVDVTVVKDNGSKVLSYDQIKTIHPQDIVVH